jgi:hypothetical protein
VLLVLIQLVGCNTAIGVQSLSDNSTGCDNVAVGLNALVCNTTASNNVAGWYKFFTSQHHRLSELQQ